MTIQGFQPGLVGQNLLSSTRPLTGDALGVGGTLDAIIEWLESGLDGALEVAAPIRVILIGQHKANTDLYVYK